jgi:ribosomal protein L11 methyltransferase
MADSYTLTLPCTRAEAEILTGDVPELALLDPAPVIVARELDENAAAPSPDDAWQMTAYFDTKPDANTVKLIQSLIPSAKTAKARVEKLPDADWVTISQRGLEPVSAGRFFVHTDSHDGAIPAGQKSFIIPASQAFGTGGHQTTAGCLAMIDQMKRQGAAPRSIADIGTGTGLLAIAALHLWPGATALASDIDPISIDVTVENALHNAVPLGVFPGQLSLCVANGTDHPLIRESAPFDLVLANILAGPLIDLAPSLAAITAPGGALILAGLLNTQKDVVVAAYRAAGLLLVDDLRFDVAGEWPVLAFRKRRTYGWARPRRASGRSNQAPGDFGSW